MRRVWLAIVLACTLPFALVACSSSSKPAPPRTPVPTEILRPTPTVGPAGATAVAAGPSVSLVPFTDPDGRYTVNVPDGWTQETNPDYVAFSLPSTTVLTTLGIFCQRGFTTDQLIAQDNNVAANVGARNVASTSATQVAGVPATHLVSSTALSTLILQNQTYYFEGKGCAWRVQLSTAGKQDFSALASRIVDSFKLTP